MGFGQSAIQIYFSSNTIKILENNRLYYLDRSLNPAHLTTRFKIQYENIKKKDSIHKFNGSPSTASQKFFLAQLQPPVVGPEKILWLAVIRGALLKSIKV